MHMSAASWRFQLIQLYSVTPETMCTHTHGQWIEGHTNYAVVEIDLQTSG